MDYFLRVLNSTPRCKLQGVLWL